MMRKAGISALVLLAAAASSAAAQESVFGIRGLGYAARPLSARAAGSAGALSLFDPAGAVNPAALGRWRTMVGWAVGEPSRRTFSGSAGDTRLTATRFPLFGFATVPSRRVTVGMAVSEYLNRTWAVRDSSNIDLGGASVPVVDLKKSVGGISDMRFGAAYHLTDRVDVGLAFHVLTGSARLSVARDISDTAYVDFVDVAETEFTGRGLSAGVIVQLVPRLLLAGSLRLNSDLTARKGDSLTHVALPLQGGLGLMYSPANGVGLVLSAEYAGWARAAADLAAAGEERSRNVWSISVGTEFETIRGRAGRVPLRLGYRWRELPFPVSGTLIAEHAFSGGVALDFSGGRTTLDLALEQGSRSAGAQRERFTTGFLGVILRP